jgi:hypothetical protein
MRSGPHPDRIRASSGPHSRLGRSPAGRRNHPGAGAGRPPMTGTVNPPRTGMVEPRGDDGLLSPTVAGDGATSRLWRGPDAVRLRSGPHPGPIRASSGPHPRLGSSPAGRRNHIRRTGAVLVRSTGTVEPRRSGWRSRSRIASRLYRVPRTAPRRSGPSGLRRALRATASRRAGQCSVSMIRRQSGRLVRLEAMGIQLSDADWATLDSLGGGHHREGQPMPRDL